MSVEDIRTRLIGIVERLPLGPMLAYGDVFNECLLDLASVGDDSNELQRIRHYLANEVGDALTRAEDALRAGQSQLSLYAAAL